MARRARPGLGSREMAVATFDELSPYVLQIRDLQARCYPDSADDMILQLAVDALESCAYHFTARPLYYEPTRVRRDFGRNHYEGLGDRAAAIAAFEALTPYWAALRRLQDNCPPFRRDYLALAVAAHGLETAAYHFTRRERFYRAKGDSAGPCVPPDW